MLVLFDIDDTLVDHSSAVDVGVATLFRELRIASDLPTFRDGWIAAMRQYFPRFLRGELTYEQQRRARMRQMVDPTLSDADADDLFRHYFDAYQAAWSLFPDVLSCLAALSSHTLGIISNGNSVEQREKLARTGIADRFETVLISGECAHAKPDPEIFRLACRAANCQVDDSIYIGDMYDIDATGARSAGLAGVWLDRQSVRRPEHAPPIIRGLDELPGLFDSRTL